MESILESWKEGIISPIFKKGDRDILKNYRGITLLNTAYKIYEMLLNDKLNEELERRKLCQKRSQVSEVEEAQ